MFYRLNDWIAPERDAFKHTTINFQYRFASVHTVFKHESIALSNSVDVASFGWTDGIEPFQAQLMLFAPNRPYM